MHQNVLQKFKVVEVMLMLLSYHNRDRQKGIQKGFSKQLPKKMFQTLLI